MTGVLRIPWRVAHAAATVFSSVSCGSGPDDATRQSGDSPGSVAPSSGTLTAPPASGEDMATGTPISVRIGDTVLTARLRDVPASRDVGYYAPADDLVLYYGDVGCFPGIVRLGRFDGSVDAIRDQTGDFDATVELA